MSADSPVIISPHGYTDSFGPNVANILKHGTRVISATVPARVRSELRAAVKAGALGHMPKDGLKPEIFFHPGRRNSAVEIRNREAAYAVSCVAQVTGRSEALVNAHREDIRSAIARATLQDGGGGNE